MKHFLLITFLLILGLSVRLYKYNTPLADWHSWRQSDTASVTREFVKHHYDILHPHYQDLSNIPSGLDNVAGYRMVEFPILNYFTAQVLLTFPQLDLVITSRLISIAFSLLSIVMIYCIVVELSHKEFLAFASALVYALLPYAVYYSRVILPEPAMIAFQLVSLASFIAWINQIQKKVSLPKRLFFGVISIATFSIALLLKPTAIFLLPVFPVVAVSILKIKAFKTWELYLFPLLFAEPLFLWRHWILQFPSGIPASAWLLNGNGIRFRPAWWRWLFADRLGRLIFGHWGLVFFVLGFFYQETKKKFSVFDTVILCWSLCMFEYMVVFATGNVQHDYYQTLIIPVLAILFARGVWMLARLAKESAYPVFSFGIIGLALALTGYFSWYEVSGYYNINNPAIVHAGQALDTLAPADAKVIAPYNGDTAFLFQTNRTGWPIGGIIDEKIKLGATYYVTTAEDDEAKVLEKKYPVIKKTPEYIIIQLKS